MALNPIIDSRDVRFVLFEQLELDKFCKKYPVYNDFDHDTLDSTLDLAEKLAVEKIWPTYKDGDREGCTFVPATKEVKIPKCYKPALDAYYETGFIAAMEDPEIGGMGMPACMYMSVAEMISAANYNIMMYPGLSHGCMGMIHTFGTPEQKEMYIPKLISGEWGGTMCLTEPDASTSAP